MNNLFLLVKATSVVFYAQKLKDNDIIVEMETLVNEIPKTKSSLVADDKKVEVLIRKLIDWIIEQSTGGDVISSLLNIKIAEILIMSPELETAFKEAFIETEVDDIRKIIFQNMREIRSSIANNQTNFKLKNILKPLIFEGETDLSKEDWLKLSDILDAKINSFNGQVDKAVMEEANSRNKITLIDILEQFKMDLSEEGILKTGLQGIDKALTPDNGFRRGLFYLINALTNRGKSFFLAHLLASFALYNKPKLKDKSKTPTIFFCSAEDSMGLVLRRMFEIFLTSTNGVKPNFLDFTSEEIVDVIMNTFKDNGWSFAFYRVDPTHDNIREFKQRVRHLEIRGAEIIVGAYDYAGMMSLEGCAGETRSDKLQDLIRQMRNFWIARNAIGITPHQLNPRAKELLRENDDESEITFVREVGGMSMTEGSTKITNEVDIEFTIHVAKLMNNKTYFTYYLGKMRDGVAPMSDRYGFYELEQDTDGKLGRGLIHDINMKPGYRKTLGNDLALNELLNEL